MGVALFIVAERKSEGFDPFVDGKALAHCRPSGARVQSGKNATRHLELLARQAGVRPLMEFFSENPESVLEFLVEEGVKPPRRGLPPEEWHSAAEGLDSVRGLLAYLTTHPDEAAEPERLIEDLRQFEEVLTRLDAEAIRWHLGVDY